MSGGVTADRLRDRRCASGRRFSLEIYPSTYSRNLHVLSDMG